ncbi:MAG: M23 family metallopeptidase, partial [Roseibium sp.]
SNSKSGGQADGVYTVSGGDTLSKIARKYDVSVDALKAANDLNGSNIRIGQSLVIPAAGAEMVDRSTTASVNKATSPKAYTPPVSAGDDSVAAKTKSDIASIAPAGTGIDKFRWPARGQVITGFAKTENGKRNDGIDISLPAGTPVKAAENGVVIYSGDGLKEYGKTVLVRHDDGLVTVYAHAQDLNVTRGDKVVRGQVIASSGMSGVAKTPRLHFEVRKNATPVDPTKYLE